MTCKNMTEEIKKSLLGMTLTELGEVVKGAGMPAFTARQLADWLYVKKVSSIDEMTNISVKNRNILKENYTIGCSNR